LAEEIDDKDQSLVEALRLVMKLAERIGDLEKGSVRRP
jgi:hypothetical protein